MELREALLIALDALAAVGASSGSPKDRDAIKKFRKDPESAPMARIMGIELRKLFAFSESQFDAQRNQLRDEIRDRYKQWLRAHEVDGGPLDVELAFKTELESVAEDIEFCANHPDHANE